MRERYRFTLIELLIVVAIIAILAAILLPALSRAKEQARIVICSNNLKQLTMGMIMYSNDNDGWLPGEDGISATNNANAPIETGRLYSIVDDPRSWICENDYRSTDFTFSYPMLGRLGCTPDTDDVTPPTGLSGNMKISPRMIDSFTTPEKVLVFGEENTETGAAPHVINDRRFINDDRFGRNHFDKAIASHLDGHIGQYPFYDNPWKNDLYENE